MAQIMAKNKIIDEFKIMKYFEISARDYYLQICADPAMQYDKVNALFKKFTDYKSRHIQIIQGIIEMLNAHL